MKNIKVWHMVGAVFTILIGSFLHFVYKLSGENIFIAALSSVNESTWEHLKLLFYPVLLFSVIEYAVWGKNFRNYIPVKVLSVLLGMLSIVVLFYTYTGIIGEHFLIIDNIVFIISVSLVYIFSYRRLKTDKNKSFSDIVLSLIGLTLLMGSFILFTYKTPHIELFRDPSGEYGITENSERNYFNI